MRAVEAVAGEAEAKVCEVQNWDMWILEKNMEKNTSIIYKNKQSVWSGSVSEGKKQIKEFIT